MRCQVARPVRRAGRGNGSGVIPTPRPGPTPTSSAEGTRARSAPSWSAPPASGCCCILPEGDRPEQVRDALAAKIQTLPETLLRSVDLGPRTGDGAMTSGAQSRRAASSSATPTHPGSAARTRTSTACCANTFRLVLTTAMAWSGQLPVASRRTPGGLTRVLSAALAGSPWVCRPPGARSRLDSTEA